MKKYVFIFYLLAFFAVDAYAQGIRSFKRAFDTADELVGEVDKVQGAVSDSTNSLAPMDTIRPSEPDDNLGRSGFRRATGARITKGIGISRMTIKGGNKKKFIDLIALYYPLYSGFELQWTALYGRILEAKSIPGLYYRFGGGVHVNNHFKFDYVEVGVDVVGGVGFVFNKIPLVVSVDFKPALEIYETGFGVSPHIALNSGYGLSVRYIMK